MDAQAEVVALRPPPYIRRKTQGAEDPVLVEGEAGRRGQISPRLAPGAAAQHCDLRMRRVDRARRFPAGCRAGRGSPASPAAACQPPACGPRHCPRSPACRLPAQTSAPLDRVALCVASSNAGSGTSQRFWADARRVGVALANPAVFPWCLANAACGALARRFGATGPNFTHLGEAEAMLSAFDCALVLKASRSRPSRRLAPSRRQRFEPAPRTSSALCVGSTSKA